MTVANNHVYSVVVDRNVPMTTRDGVTLRADVYHPSASGRFPVLLVRTPYDKDGIAANPTSPPPFFTPHGYVTVVQDCRGRFASEGEFEPIFQEITDGYDAVEWAARLPYSNGHVGTCGQSYFALAQYAILCNEQLPPSLEAMAVTSGPSDAHASWAYHTGGPAMWGWLIPYAIHMARIMLDKQGKSEALKPLDDYLESTINFGMPLRDSLYRQLPIDSWIELLKDIAPYIRSYIEHPDDGPFWYRANVQRHAAKVNVPILHISSWYDIFAEGALGAFRTIKDQSDSKRARGGQRLVMGPWAHLFPYTVPTSQGTGDIDFGPEARVELYETQLKWFDFWLKDLDTGFTAEPPARIFVMGINRWRSLEDWPDPRTQYVRYFLHSAGHANSVQGDGLVSTAAPGDEPPDTYVYDPEEPVPTLGGANLTITLGVADQRPVEQRQDVLVYTSEVLDRSLEVTGPVTVALWATTSEVDTDFTAKLVDVHPDGYARNLVDGVIRARYRQSASSPSPVIPGEPFRYAIDLWATSNVFMPGHRIRLEVSSSNFPRFDRNPNTGEPFGRGTEMRSAHQMVHHTESMASYVLLPVIPSNVVD